MNIVITGHVDHGKSTIIGRLLADTDSLPKDKLEQVRKNCELNSRPFEYAFLLDALKDEQSQGITIDSARVFFKSQKRNYIIIDAPGHIEFLKNMISGAARADAALLVIDAEEGIKENSRRHGYMLSMLGIKQVVVLVNKMDLVNYEQKVYLNIVSGYTEFLKNTGLEPKSFIPVSGRDGENIISNKGKMAWYKGISVINALDELINSDDETDKPFRMAVQDVYKFTGEGDNRRIVAGNISTGQISIGDEIVFYPSGKKSHIKNFESLNSANIKYMTAGMAAGFTLTEQIYITRGELACKGNEAKPVTGKRLKVELFWLAKIPMVLGKDYLFKIGTEKVTAKLEKIHKIINSSNLEIIKSADKIAKHDVAECTLILNKSVAFDFANENPATGRFVIVDNYEIAGGGIITGVLEDTLSHYREDVIERNYKWETGKVSVDDREQKYRQKSSLILITGRQGSGRKEIAKQLEKCLFKKGLFSYYLGIGSIKYGLDADIKNVTNSGEEHIRRFAEAANILLDAGIILIATARDLSEYDLEIIKNSVDEKKIKTVWIGDSESSRITADVILNNKYESEKTVEMLLNALSIF